MYKQLPQKDVQNVEKQERKKGYKLCYTYKNQGLEVSKYVQSHPQTWAGARPQNSFPDDPIEAKPPILKSCLRPWLSCNSSN